MSNIKQFMSMRNIKVTKNYVRIFTYIVHCTLGLTVSQINLLNDIFPPKKSKRNIFINFFSTVLHVLFFNKIRGRKFCGVLDDVLATTL